MSKTKKIIISISLILLAITCNFAISAIAKSISNAATSDVFFDDFEGDTLDTSKWLIAEKAWGGNNGGVVPENVSVSNGTLKLEGHGNYYKGDVKGYNRDNGIRTGAAIATREYYSSGSYEVVAKVAPVYGACSAIWTFEYEEYYPGDPEYAELGATGSYYEVNHEIDIEMPGRPSSNAEPSFDYALCNTFVRENTQTTNFTNIGYSQADGNWHKYRFDWHTGDEGQEPRVEYYVDDKLVKVCYTTVPTNAGRFWIGIWFPCAKDADKDGVAETGWTGTANFDTAIFEIDSVKITPFNEAGDTPQKETYGKDGWAVDSFPEDIEAESYNHIVNGEFTDGANNWKLSGDAKISDSEKAVLSSGSKTDTISQNFNVKPKMTYTLTADVETDGTEVTIGVRKLNGSNATITKVTESGRVQVTFVTDRSVKEMQAYIEVLRYQNSKNNVYVDNITLYPGTPKDSDIPSTPDVPEEPETPDEPEIPDTPDVPDVPDVPDTPDEPDEPEVPDTPEIVGDNLIVNGDFAKDKEGWNTSGSTIIANGVATLASGNDTDRLTQKVNVERGTTYILTADITTTGAEVTLGVNDYFGRYTQKSKSVTKSGKIEIRFTTADHIDKIEVYGEVLRYQDNKENTTIDNIKLVKVNEPKEEQTELPPRDLPEDTLIADGHFNDSSKWELVGSAKLENGKVVLASGRDTDIVKQTVKVKSNTTYKLTADISTTGAIADLVVSGYNGKYTKITNAYSANSNGELVFTTGDNVTEVTVYVHVLRYQPYKNEVIVENMALEEIQE